MIITVQQSYGALREPQYPAAGQQLDAIFKLARALHEQGIALPSDTLAWIEACQAVKDMFPKEPGA